MKKVLLASINLEKILEETPFPAFFLDRNSRILKVNQAFLKFLKREREEVEGKFCYEIIHNLKEKPSFCPLKDGEICFFMGCERESQLCLLCSLCEEEKRVFLKGIYIKEFFEPSLKRFLRVTLIPLYESKGELLGYLHFLEEFTQEKEIAKILEIFINHFKGIFFVNDESFDVLYKNKNLESLYKGEEKKCFEVLYGRNLPCEGCPFLSLRTSGEDIVYSPKLKKWFKRYYQIFPFGEKIHKVTFYTHITEEIGLFEEAGIPLIVTTPEGKILWANKRARELFGLSEEDLQYHKAQDFWMDPLERDSYLERLFKEKEVRSLEVRLKKKTGESFIGLISSKLYEDGGPIIYSAVEDITAYLKIKEEALSFVKKVIEFLPVGLAIIDVQDRVLWVNPKLSEITGYSTEELIGANLHQLLIADPVLKKRAQESFKNIASGAHSALAKKIVDFWAKRKDENTFLAEVCFDEFFWEGQRVFIGTIQDVTERKLIEDRLLKLEREALVEKIARGIAHDLNNYLFVVKGYLDLLKEKAKDFLKEEGKYIERMERAFTLMQGLVHQFFILASQEIKKIEFVNLKEFIESWAPFYLRGSAIELRLEIEEDFYLPIQQHHFLSLLQNLLLNAKEVLRDEGEIRIRVSKLEDWARIEFSDNGPGILPEHLPKIFELGFSTKAEGSGLGLFIVKKIVEFYKGKIKVESQIGQGTTFIIELPGVQLKREERLEELFKESPKGLYKILILDDEEGIRELLREFLSGQGILVETAQEGDLALEKILSAEREERPFTHLILDLTVPYGKGGIYLINKLKEKGLDPNKYKIILITGYTAEDVKKETKDIKIDAVLYKPFKLENILEVL